MAWTHASRFHGDLKPHDSEWKTANEKPLENRASGNRLLPMKVTTMTLTSKRQTVFPLEWCRREGLERGGSLNVFDLGENGLLVRPVRPLTKGEVARLLAQSAAGPHSPEEATAIVDRALRKVRRT